MSLAGVPHRPGLRIAARELTGSDLHERWQRVGLAR